MHNQLQLTKYIRYTRYRRTIPNFDLLLTAQRGEPMVWPHTPAVRIEHPPTPRRRRSAGGGPGGGSGSSNAATLTRCRALGSAHVHMPARVKKRTLTCTCPHASKSAPSRARAHTVPLLRARSRPRVCLQTLKKAGGLGGQAPRGPTRSTRTRAHTGQATPPRGLIGAARARTVSVQCS